MKYLDDDQIKELLRDKEGKVIDAVESAFLLSLIHI